MSLRFAKTEPGRYYAKGESYTYLAVRDQGGWTMQVFKAEIVAGLKISGAEVGESWHDVLSLAKRVAAIFEQLGDDYQSAEHGHRSRHLEAITRAHQEGAS
jgi:hypothetical protein